MGITRVPSRASPLWNAFLTSLAVDRHVSAEVSRRRGNKWLDDAADLDPNTLLIDSPR